jgi:hypothetical protein
MNRTQSLHVPRSHAAAAHTMAAMHVMQYTIPLPADYDMASIRRRVAGRAAVFDTWPDLGFKAFLITERGRTGAVANSYAPFYLWTAVQGMNDFLYGPAPGFGGIIASFGRPPIDHLVGLTHWSAARGGRPISATREVVPIDPGADLASLRAEELERPHDQDAYSSTAALDPRSWRLVRLTLWNVERDGYQVLHLSEPRQPGA